MSRGFANLHPSKARQSRIVAAAAADPGGPLPVGKCHRLNPRGGAARVAPAERKAPGDDVGLDLAGAGQRVAERRQDEGRRHVVLLLDLGVQVSHAGHFALVDSR